MVLLLTATIHPSSNHMKRGRVDYLDRENDYFEAVQFYLSKGYHIVFCENSNTFSEKILKLQTSDQRLEYLTFQSELSVKGKSWGEIEIFNYALENSKFIKEVDYLVKITGRYIIKNIEEILTATNFVEKEVYINPTRNFRWADSRLMIMRKSYYYNFFIKTVDLYLNEQNRIFMENVFMRSLFLYLYEGGELVLWPTYPCYEAYDGTHNEKVTFGFFKSLKYKIYYKIKKAILKHRA